MLFGVSGLLLLLLPRSVTRICLRICGLSLVVLLL